MKIKFGYFRPMGDYPIVALLNSPFKQKTLEELDNLDLHSIDLDKTLNQIIKEQETCQ